MDNKDKEIISLKAELEKAKDDLKLANETIEMINKIRDNLKKERRDAWAALENANELIKRLRMFGDSFTVETIDAFLNDNERASLDYDAFIRLLQSRIKTKQLELETARELIREEIKYRGIKFPDREKIWEERAKEFLKKEGE